MTGKLSLFAVAAILFCGWDTWQHHTPRVNPDASLRRVSESGQTKTQTPVPNIPAGLEGEFKMGDIAAATAWADRLNLADWLGPLAPLALSPFFGVACLSGLALWGPDAITDNALLGSAGPLRREWLFIVFAALALLTSLPRLTKVSKPFAQAMDRVEAYAVVIILLAIKFTAGDSGDSPAMTADGLTFANSPVVFQAGIISMTAETLLMFAMAVNVLVINSVKFFFEFLVWLTPFPTVDAIFEICNKALCAGLMTIYAFSPTLATIINLGMLFVAAIMLRWTARRVKFYRTMLLDPFLARVWRAYGMPGQHGLVVFPESAIGSFPAKSCLRLVRDGSGWALVPSSSWSPLSWVSSGGRRAVVLCEKTRPRLQRGWLTHRVAVRLAEDQSDDEKRWTLTTSRRYDQQFSVLVETLSIEMHEENADHVSTTSKAEFA
jgi:hypothetical protein